MLVLYGIVRHLLHVVIVLTSIPACAAAIVAAAAVGVQCRAAECATIWACPGPCRLPAVGLPGTLSVQVRADLVSKDMCILLYLGHLTLLAVLTLSLFPTPAYSRGGQLPAG